MEKHTDSLFKGLDAHSLGTHKWVFLAALRCKEAGLPKNEAIVLIESHEPNMPRGFKHNEVSEAVANAYKSETRGSSTPKYPPLDKELQRRVIAVSQCSIATLQQCSPEPLNQGPKEILEKLFPNNPLLCVSREFDRGTITHTLSGISPSYLKGASFVVPSPMSGRLGRTLEGKPSPHTLSNTGNRYYLVCEIDDKSITKNAQAGIINYLADFAPLVAVVDSGGKSLHAWFWCFGANETREGNLMKFFISAVQIGADPRMWSPSQFTRMPNGTRRTHETPKGLTQSLIYFNPLNRRKGSPIPTN
jgi:hypothetical protein